MLNPVRMIHVFPSFERGGTELRITRVINRLPFPAHHGILALKGGVRAVDNIEPGISFELVSPPGGYGSITFPIGLRRCLKQWNPDLLLTYNWGAIEAVFAARLGAHCAIIHNESGFGSDEAACRKTRRCWARRLLLSGIEATIVNSESLLEIALREYRLPPHKVELIRNGIDVSRFVPGRNNELRAKLGIREGAILFGFIGRLREEKNLGMMIEAFASASLTDAKLVIVGDGPCRRQAKDLVARQTATERILFPGETSDPRPYLNAFDIFVMSSATEQTPNALLEAAACGLPAISTDVGDVRAILGSNGSPVVVPSNDVAALRECMEILAANQGLRCRLGAANRARCAELYSLDRMVGQFAQIYQRAIEVQTH